MLGSRRGCSDISIVRAKLIIALAAQFNMNGSGKDWQAESVQYPKPGACSTGRQLMGMRVLPNDSFALSSSDPKARRADFTSAAQFDRSLALTGGINAWYHFREPAPIDNQPVIRMNRDTLYSGAIVDISEGAKLTLPDPGERYLSVMVVNEDHYVNRIFHDPGTYELSMDEFDTPYVLLAVRTLIDASDPNDIREANALQDQFVIEANSAKPYSHPVYDADSYKATYDPLLELSRGVPDARKTFGKKEDVDAVRHLLGTAWGWAGLPEHEAFYLNVEPNLPVGAYTLNIEDVPVDAFWSVSVYNREGFFEENDLGAYSVNSITGTPNTDGSFTIHFGGDPASDNHLPIADGWNYTVRLYQPRDEVLDGSWSFPEVEPIR